MAVGDVKQMYRRNYICVNPDSSAGPATWRLASSQISGTPGTINSKLYDFDGEAPINVDVTSGDRDQVTTSMDISQLDDRAD